jgi:hypothetical protein
MVLFLNERAGFSYSGALRSVSCNGGTSGAVCEQWS